MTNTFVHWPSHLLSLCKENSLHSLVEFGSGNGKLGLFTLLRAKKERYPLFWSGVEINEALQNQTKHTFAKNNLNDNLMQLVTNLQDLHLTQPCLFIFSYSLDNLSPDIFVNTKDQLSFPDAMVGVTVKSGLLSEKILPSLLPTHVNLSEWKLQPYQRLYCSMQALTIFLQVLSLLPQGSKILILDEFTTQEITPLTLHIGTPKNLLTYERYERNLSLFYQEAGRNLLYFPLHLEAFLHMLDTLHLTYTYDTEKRFLETLDGKKTPPDTKSLTHAILIDVTKKIEIPAKIPFYPK